MPGCEAIYSQRFPGDKLCSTPLEAHVCPVDAIGQSLKQFVHNLGPLNSHTFEQRLSRTLCTERKFEALLHFSDRDVLYFPGLNSRTVLSPICRNRKTVASQSPQWPQIYEYTVRFFSRQHTTSCPMLNVVSVN